jgi:hypothetical protein
MSAANVVTQKSRLPSRLRPVQLRTIEGKECWLLPSPHTKSGSSDREPSLNQLRRWISFVIATEEATSPEGDGKN